MAAALPQAAAASKMPSEVQRPLLSVWGQEIIYFLNCCYFCLKRHMFLEDMDGRFLPSEDERPITNIGEVMAVYAS